MISSYWLGGKSGALSDGSSGEAFGRRGVRGVQEVSGLSSGDGALRVPLGALSGVGPLIDGLGVTRFNCAGGVPACGVGAGVWVWAKAAVAVQQAAMAAVQSRRFIANIRSLPRQNDALSA